MVKTHIELEGIKHGYGGKPVLEIAGLSIARGATLALIGPNGSGKSTLLRLIGLLERPLSGEVRVDGVDPWGRRGILDFRRKMAAVFQEPLLFAGSVFDNVAYGLKLRRVSKGDIVRRVRQSLERVGISHLEGRPANALSGGEAQRTSLARALALEPEALLLDEPLASLDPQTREALLVDFERILKGSGVTTVYVTHNRTEALRMGDSLAVMIGGSIDQVGPAREVFSRPASEEIAHVVGCENLIPGIVTGSSEGLVAIKVGGGEIEALSDAAPGDEVTACIRPEDITIYPGDAPISSARNNFKGSVIEIIDLGPLSKVRVGASIELIAFVTKRSAEEMKLREGVPVTAAFKATGVHTIKGPACKIAAAEDIDRWVGDRV